MTFKEIHLGGLFITGPDNSMFMKLSERSQLCARELATGRWVSVPENRVVTLPTRKDFSSLATRYEWEILYRGVNNEIRQHSVRFPNICEHAKLLKVSREHLYRVLSGKRHSAILMARYKALVK